MTGLWRRDDRTHPGRIRSIIAMARCWPRVRRSDRTLAVRPVITRREGAGRLRDRALESCCDRTRKGCVKSSLTYANITTLREACTVRILGRVRSRVT
jgi:hypothetical protein